MSRIRSIDQVPGDVDANRDAEVPSNFTPLGEATQAVVMRLSSKLPRIKVAKVAEGGNSSKPWPRPAK